MLYRITTRNSTYEVEAYEGRPSGRVRRTTGGNDGHALRLGEWVDVAVHGSGLAPAGSYAFVLPSGEAVMTSTVQRFERVVE